MGFGDKDAIVRVWVRRSKDATRTRVERDYAWAKALELAAEAPGYHVVTPDNGRTELHKVRNRRPAPARESKYGYREGGEMLETVRIYRTRENGKPRTRRVGGKRHFGMRLI